MATKLEEIEEKEMYPLQLPRLILPYAAKQKLAVL
jgi:hypothetical protein